MGTASHLPHYNWKYLAGRIVFPVRDENGVLKGFSGREAQAQAPLNPPEGGKPILPPSGGTRGAPKYCNTSSDHGFYSSRVLYGLYRAKDAIRECGTVYLVEGFKDCIAMHAAGFTNTVAIMGSNPSEEQCRLITEYADQVVLFFDGDKAGEKATRTALDMLPEEMEVIVIYTSAGEDPDSLFRRLGREEFRTYVQEATLYQADPYEKLFITACLLYPAATKEVEGETYLYTQVADHVLVYEEIPLTSPAHTRILKHLADYGIPPAGGEPDAGLCTELLDTYSATILKNAYGVETEEVLDTLFLLYADRQLIKQIRSLIRRLHRETDPSVRLGLLKKLDNRKDLHRYISEALEYPGAVL